VWKNCIYRNLSRVFSVFFAVVGGCDQEVEVELLVDEGRLARLEFASADLTLVWFRQTTARPTSSHLPLIMPRKAAPKVAEDGEPVEAQAPRRSTRISSQPKPAEEPANPAKKPAAPRKKRNVEEADTQEENNQEDNAKKVGIFPPYDVSRA
jgi:outer membrane biosynthesis protein TonB